MKDQLAASNSVEFFYPLIAEQQYSRLVPNDPLFFYEWHLRNTGQSGGTVGEDANIVNAWNTYTGSGVVIGIVDDGLQFTHTDLDDAGKYDPALSYDFNDGDADPTPAAGQSHGTQMAGVAAAPNNSWGVVGAAPGATLAGLRLTAAATDDATQADALSYMQDAIDIYNNSWGSADNGLLSGPGPLTLAAIEDGVTNGREGLGNVFVWAAGNGAASGDNVNYDGYANSRYTIAVSAVDHNGRQALYSEPGAPILVAGYSSNFLTSQKGFAGVTTTTLTGTGDLQSPPNTYDYTKSVVGTSAAAAQVSGVVALMLQANPNLTWRDVEHILVNSASHTNPSDSGWATNFAGHDINHKFGFGAVDALAAVNLAASWTNVGPEVSLSTGLITVGEAIPDDDPTGVSSTIFVPQAIKLETVEVVLNATHTYRGDLRVVLTSPWGTESVLSEVHNDGGDNYSSWVFTTVRDWDELTYGDWTLTVSDGYGADVGTLDSWQLNFYGTESDAHDFGDAPDTYGTLAASDGARHLIGGLNLGATVDWEDDGQPSSDGLGDGTDEDGVFFIDPFVAGETTYFAVTTKPGGGELDFFVDFNGSGIFGDDSNEIFSTTLSGNTEIIGVDVPADAVIGTTFARFRLSSAGGLGPIGAALDGEVEDYSVQVYSESPLRDFGDAPDAVYGTVRVDGGPSHIIGGPYLGSTVDAEADGQGNAVATGDGIDEDGVNFGDLMITGLAANIDVTSSPGGGELNFFIDFNANGIFGDTPSEVYQTTLSGGTESIQIVVPLDAAVGVTYARFRISSAGDLGPLWMAPDGEVEDYQLVILGQSEPTCDEWEYFDGVTAPALPAGWTNVSTGENWVTVGSGADTAPNHAFVADYGTVSENRLESPIVDTAVGIYGLKFRNYYNMEANWDGGVLEISINGGPRQDIVAAGGSFVVGGYNSYLFGGSPLNTRDVWTGNSGGYIDTIVNLPPAAIGQMVQFFWIEGTDTSVLWEGWHIDTVELCRSGDLLFDYGDAPDPPYATLSADDGAGHVFGGSLYLGASVDIDADGQQSPDATGDTDDGVTFTSPLIPGATATVDVVASEAGLLSAWVDFNGDGDWSDPGEQVYRDLLLSAGTNGLAFDVPTDATATHSFARFRVSTQSGLWSSGLAPDGEVEDYEVYIGIDYGDAPDDPYGTLAASNGASHIVNGLRLGGAVDQELDGQPSADALGDGADEDGIVFLEPMVAGDHRSDPSDFVARRWSAGLLL